MDIKQIVFDSNGKIIQDFTNKEVIQNSHNASIIEMFVPKTLTFNTAEVVTRNLYNEEKTNFVFVDSSYVNDEYYKLNFDIPQSVTVDYGNIGMFLILLVDSNVLMYSQEFNINVKQSAIRSQEIPEMSQFEQLQGGINEVAQNLVLTNENVSIVDARVDFTKVKAVLSDTKQFTVEFNANLKVGDQVIVLKGTSTHTEVMQVATIVDGNVTWNNLGMINDTFYKEFIAYKETMDSTFASQEELNEVIKDIPKQIEDNNLVQRVESDGTYANTVKFEYDNQTGNLTAKLSNPKGEVISTTSINLPTEDIVVSGEYEASSKSIILTLIDGGTISIPVADLVGGLASETYVNQKVEDEALSRVGADNSLDAKITAEANARVSSDSALSTEIGKRLLITEVGKSVAPLDENGKIPLIYLYEGQVVITNTTTVFDTKLNKTQAEINQELLGADQPIVFDEVSDVVGSMAVELKDNTNAVFNMAYGSTIMQLYNHDDAPSTQTINGITFTKKNDGSYTVNGTSTNSFVHYLNELNFSDNKFLLKGMMANDNTGIELRVTDGLTRSYSDNGGGVIFSYTKTTQTTLKIGIYVASGVTITNAVFYPNLIKLSNAHYENHTLEELHRTFPNVLPYGFTHSNSGSVSVSGVNLFDKQLIYYPSTSQYYGIYSIDSNLTNFIGQSLWLKFKTLNIGSIVYLNENMFNTNLGGNTQFTCDGSEYSVNVTIKDTSQTTFIKNYQSNPNNEEGMVYDVMLSYEDKDYEKYFINTLSTSYIGEMKSVDDFRNSYNFITGEKITTVEYPQFDGSFAWNYESQNTDTEIARFTLRTDTAYKANGSAPYYVIPNNFGFPGTGTTYGNTKENIQYSVGLIYFSISYGKITGYDPNGTNTEKNNAFKAYIQTNNLICGLVLETPTTTIIKPQGNDLIIPSNYSIMSQNNTSLIPTIFDVTGVQDLTRAVAELQSDNILKQREIVALKTELLETREIANENSQRIFEVSSKAFGVQIPFEYDGSSIYTLSIDRQKLIGLQSLETDKPYKWEINLISYGIENMIVNDDAPMLFNQGTLILKNDGTVDISGYFNERGTVGWSSYTSLTLSLTAFASLDIKFKITEI